MNCLFLYHPKSGRGKVAKKIGYIRRTLCAHFGHVDIVATESGEEMTEYARDGAERYDVILFSGGDGTFNRVLQGIGGRDVRLGYLPGGTTNDVARSLGIPRNVKGALQACFLHVVHHLEPVDMRFSYFNCKQHSDVLPCILFGLVV